MKILFLCGSAESGKDGVGDYTRTLSCDLLAKKHNVEIISLFDRQAGSFFSENQGVNSFSYVLVNRIPMATSNKQRLIWVQKIIARMEPDWISLQYVPYGFHSKGLPFWLPSFLSKLKGNHQWQIMFHEVWIGISVISPINHKIIGFLQQRIVKKIIDYIAPSSIITSNILYQLVLKSKGISAEIVPLFSSIPKLNNDISISNYFLKKLDIKEENINNYTFIGVFGSIYPEANLKTVLQKLLNKSKKNKKQLVFINFGKNNKEGINEIDMLKNYFLDKIKFNSFGILSEEEISVLLQLLDIGISCTPEQHLGKSSVYAAMKLHGIDVLMSSSKEIPEYEEELQKYMSTFTNRPSHMWGVDFISNKFITLLNK
jgi:hypothetical protein